MHPPKAKARARDEAESGPNGVERDVLGVQVSEHDVETEFWRLVDSKNETVEVEYGADIHSTLSDRLVLLMWGRCADGSLAPFAARYDSR
jgi:hypothetical protein